MVWRESRRELIRWFVSKSMPWACTAYVLPHNLETKSICHYFKRGSTLNLNGFSLKIILYTWNEAILNFFICIYKITCKPMGNFAENLNLGNRVRPPPKSYMYKFWQKMDWNSALMVLPNTYSLMKRMVAPLQPPEIIYFCKFRPQRAWNYGYLACKIQDFPRQGGATPLQPHTYTFWQKGTEIVHLWFHPTTHSLFSYGKKSYPPLQPPDIIHFC